MPIKWRRIGAGMALMFAIFANLAAAQGAGQPGDPAASAQAGRGPLDGMSFVGKIGPENNPDLDDELHFAGGQFWSTNCVACGYQPGVYWTRRIGDRIQFHGTLQSPDRGRFDFSGHVDGGQIDVHINWTQPRWYGDIERKLTFIGALATTAPPPGAAALPIGNGSQERAQCRRL
jgi:hypothetical protein